MRFLDNRSETMSRISRVVLLALMFAVASCNDTSGPAAETDTAPVAERTPHFLTWESAVPQFTATVGNADGELALADQPYVSAFTTTVGDEAGPYTVSFWAVRGQERELEINYDDNGTVYHFLELKIEDPVTSPDGSPIAVGDSVLITAIVDPAVLAVQLEPSGLQFGQRTKFKMWYTAAGGDLNGDGVVDNDDSYIENELLELWFQSESGEPWQPINSWHYTWYDLFRADLEHFSGYAVSW
jgi:hypothetical protein